MIKSFLYIVRKFRVATALNLIGLSMAFSTMYFLVTQIVFSDTYNKSIPGYENCYRMEIKGIDFNESWNDNLTYNLYDTLQYMDCIDEVAALSTYKSMYELMVDSKWLSFWVADVTPTWFHFVGARVLYGKIDTMDAGKMVVSKSFAQRYFKRENVVGDTIPFRDFPIEIVAVIDDLEENILGSSDQFRIIIPEKQSSINYDLQILLRVENADDTTRIKQQFCQYFRQEFENEPDIEQYYSGESPNVEARLNPLSATFSSNVESQTDFGSRIITLLLKLAVMMIFVVSLVNFANFSLAQAPSRIRSVNIRKILGSSNASLRISLLAESVFLSLLALALSLPVIMFMVNSGSLDSITSGSLSLDDNLGILLNLVLVSIVMGLAAGAYPAWFCTSFDPALAVKGSYGLSPKGKMFRTCLVILQFTSTLVIVPFIWLQQKQTSYIFDADYGFDKDKLLFVELPTSVMACSDSVRTAIEQICGVDGVAYSQFLIGRSHGHPIMTRSHPCGENMLFSFETCSHNYPKVLGLKILDGRGFVPGDTNAVIINETMRREHPFLEIGKPLGDNLPIVVGVCADMRLSSMKTDDWEVESLVIYPMAETAAFTAFSIYTMQLKMTIRVEDDASLIETSNLIKQWFAEHFPCEIIHVEPYNMAIGGNYSSFTTLMNGIWIVAAAIMLMTLIGTLCLTMFECEYRRKEICIRKILGGSCAQIIALLCRRYIVVLSVSFMLSLPVTWFLGSEWLSNFDEHVEFSWGISAVSFVVVSLFVVSVVVVYALKTAMEKPVDSIKREV